MFSVLYAHSTRALLILGCAAGLQYGMHHSPILVRAQWNYWVAANVVVFLVLPLILGHVLLSDGPSEFGVVLGDWRTGLTGALALYGAMLPLLIIASRIPAVQAFYLGEYLPAVPEMTSGLALAVTTIVYMLAWEFFFRGFLLFGLKPALDSTAIPLQTVFFCLGHIGKPVPELVGSIVAGLALGVLCWRARAFWPAFVTHALSHVTFNFLVLAA